MIRFQVDSTCDWRLALDVCDLSLFTQGEQKQEHNVTARGTMEQNFKTRDIIQMRAAVIARDIPCPSTLNQAERNGL